MSVPTIVALILPVATGALAGALLTAMHRKREELDTLRAERVTSDETFTIADRVLNDPDTPAILRRAILILLFGLRSEKSGHEFFRPMGREESTADGSRLMNSIAELRERHPALADDAQRAIAGLIVLMASLYADSASEIEETRNTAAYYPFKLLSRVRLPSISSDDDCRLPLGTAQA